MINLQLNNRCYSDGQCHTLGELRKLSSQWFTQLDELNLTQVAIIADKSFLLLLAAIGAASSQRDTVLVPRSRYQPSTETHLKKRGYGIVEFDSAGVVRVLHPSTAPQKPLGEVMLLTSGTTGEPKLLAHSWRSLNTFSRVENQPEQRWLVPYLPGTYAWTQMVSMFFSVPGQHLVLPESVADPKAAWEETEKTAVTAISSTPTFWKMLLLTVPRSSLQSAPITQITLGGEPVRQHMLDRLHELYPKARISHIYASTEVGASIVVHDGKEGFPADWLNKETPGRPALRVSDGILEINSPFAAKSATGWYSTGDEVEEKDGRIVVIGRKSEKFINVGGQKVDGTAVERVLLDFKGILWCEVSGRRSPLTGGLVVAKVVIAPDFDEISATELEKRLTAHCQTAGLPDWMIPRIWSVAREIPVSANFKSELSAPQKE